MRILSRKIWRAFPELDQFDDETCRRYMNRSTKVYESGLGCLLLFLVVVAAFTAWIFIEYNARVLLYTVLKALGIKMGIYTDTFVGLLAYSGFIWFPWIAALLLRDRWLFRSILKQLNGALCKECEYSLLGLIVVIDSDTWKYVLCPECGTKNGLESGVLAESDIDPALLIKS